MATFEITFNIVAFATTVAVLLYLRYLVKPQARTQSWILSGSNASKKQRPTTS